MSVRRKGRDSVSDKPERRFRRNTSTVFDEELERLEREGQLDGDEHRDAFAESLRRVIQACVSSVGE